MKNSDCNHPQLRLLIDPIKSATCSNGNPVVCEVSILWPLRLREVLQDRVTTGGDAPLCLTYHKIVIGQNFGYSSSVTPGAFSTQVGKVKRFDAKYTSWISAKSHWLISHSTQAMVAAG
jgi:hypothetical protein